MPLSLVLVLSLFIVGNIEHGRLSEVGCIRGGSKALNLPYKGSTVCLFVKETILGLSRILSRELVRWDVPCLVTEWAFQCMTKQWALVNAYFRSVIVLFTSVDQCGESTKVEESVLKFKLVEREAWAKARETGRTLWLSGVLNAIESCKLHAWGS
jgi:hypothetical protein